MRLLIAALIALPACKLASSFTSGGSSTPSSTPSGSHKATAAAEDNSSGIAKLAMPADTAPGWKGPLFMITGTQPGTANMGVGQLSVSNDGQSWRIASKTKKADALTYTAAAAGNGRIVVLHQYGALYSRDGKAWERAETFPKYGSGDPVGIMEDIAFGDGLFVAVGHDSNIVASRDGDTWAAYTGQIDPSTTGNVACYEVKFIASKFYVTCSGSRIVVFAVKDSDLVWLGAKAYGAHDPAYLDTDGQGTWVAAASQAAWYGSDPLKLEEAGGKTPFNAAAVVFVAGRFLAPASHNKIYWTKDGKAWDEKQPDTGPLTSWGDSITVDGTAYITSLTDGIVLKTTDGKSFEPVGMSSANLGRIYDINYAP